jgi:hypothetical protein
VVASLRDWCCHAVASFSNSTHNGSSQDPLHVPIMTVCACHAGMPLCRCWCSRKRPASDTPS